MGYMLRDIQAAHITDVASADLSGSDGISEANLETQNATYVTAINTIIVALENVGILAKA